MISFEKFWKIFEKRKDTAGKSFDQKEVQAFFDSIPESYSLFLAEDDGFEELLELVKKKQWPLLRRIADENLKIYAKIDDLSSLTMFVNSIRDEMIIRGQKGLNRNDFNRALYLSNKTRIRLYPDIFQFNDKDWQKCRESCEKIRARKREKHRRNRMLKKIACAAAGAVGVVILGRIGKTIQKKSPEEKDRKKKNS